MQEKLGIKNIYRFYKKKTDKPVPSPQFRRVWESFITEVVQSIVLTGKDFNMPSLGSLGIRKKKIIVKMTPDGDIDKRNLRPDWAKTKELWARDPEAKKRKQLVFHLNKHFNGYDCKWFWDKATCSVPNYGAYSFAMTRGNKRYLAHVLKDDELDVDYHETKPKIRSYEHSN